MFHIIYCDQKIIARIRKLQIRCNLLHITQNAFNFNHYLKILIGMFEHISSFARLLAKKDEKNLEGTSFTS